MSETTKILVVSDVHGRMRDLRWVLQNETADAMFYLGDGLYDLNGALELNKTPVPYPIYRVAGNCDVGYQEPTEGMAPFAGVLGHTHRRELVRGVGTAATVFNPGSLRDGGSYGVITVTDGQCEFSWKRVPQF